MIAVTRLAKSAVPPETKLQKDVPLALVKGSTIFINYLSALAHDTAVDQGHKTITAAHVLEAVKQLGWEDTGDLSKLLKRELKGACFGSASFLLLVLLFLVSLPDRKSVV